MRHIYKEKVFATKELQGAVKFILQFAFKLREKITLILTGGWQFSVVNHYFQSISFCFFFSIFLKVWSTLTVWFLLSKIVIVMVWHSSSPCLRISAILTTATILTLND